MKICKLFNELKKKDLFRKGVLMNISIKDSEIVYCLLMYDSDHSININLKLIDTRFFVF